MTTRRAPAVLWIGLVGFIVLAAVAALIVKDAVDRAARGCAAGIAVSFVGEVQGTDLQAETASPGDVIDYTVQLNVADSQCSIRDGTVTVRLPDGSTSTIASGVTLARGETVTFTRAGSYTVDSADIGTSSGAVASGAVASDVAQASQIRAAAEVIATSYRDDGSADDVEAGTTFTTTVIEPGARRQDGPG
jgi:hypothetical protein